MIVALALLLDWLFKEPAKFHPLVGFGNWVKLIQREWYQASRARGLVLWCLAVLPIVILVLLLQIALLESPWYWLFAALSLYLCIGWQSLGIHAINIYDALQQNYLEQARIKVGYIVSRDTSELNESQISSAACESVLENGADAIFAAIFWFLLLGPVGAVLYRLANTLDAMWGYKNEQYLKFGWFAAKMDDALNFIPARLTAFSYALVGHFNQAMSCWASQGKHWKSPNAGPVMASGAGALGISLGGRANYHGQEQVRPLLGIADHPPQANDIKRAVALVNRALCLWVIVIVMVALWRT